MEINQVVWGKIRGYPWWPGLIAEISDKGIKINFIGDNTSEVFKHKNVKEFPGEDSELFNSKRKDLRLAIDYAERFMRKELLPNELEQANQEISKELRKKRTPEHIIKSSSKTSTNLKKLKTLLENILRNPTFSTSETESKSITELIPIFSTLEEFPNKTTSFEALTECIINILNSFPNLEANIMKLLKIFSDTFENNPKKSLENLSSMVYSIYLTWKNNLITQGLDPDLTTKIRNVKLRKHVCRKFASIIQKKTQSQREAQIQALNIEENIRFKFPEMGEEYIRSCKLRIKTLNSEVSP